MNIFDIPKHYDRLAIFADYDGTIIPLTSWEPHKAKPDREIIHIVRELSRIPNVQLTIISGRNFKELVGYFPYKGILVAGAHGGIIRDRVNKLYYLIPPQKARYSVRLAEGFVRMLIRRQYGFVLEDKLIGFALHYGRGYLETKQKVLDRINEFFERVALNSEFNLYDWRSSIELIHRTVSKGNAVKYILDNLTPSYYFPIYFGDDITDKSAYETIAEHSGKFYFVGENIDNVETVREFLKRVIAQYKGRRSEVEDLGSVEEKVKEPKRSGWEDILRKILEYEDERSEEA